MNFVETHFLINMIRDSRFFNEVKRRGYTESILTDRVNKVIFKHLMQMTHKEIHPDLLHEAVSRDMSGQYGFMTIVANRSTELFDESVEVSPYAIEIVEDYAKKATYRDIISESVKVLTEDDDVDRALGILQRVNDLQERGATYELHAYNTLEAWNDREKQRRDRITNAEDVLTWNKMSWNATYMIFGQPPCTLLGVAAQTGVGKSIYCINYTWEAASPPNGKNVLLIVAENRYIEAASRLDSILLNMPYDKLRKESSNNVDGDVFFADQTGWGNVFIAKCIPTKFSAHTIASIIEEVHYEYDIKIEVLVVDSPDHMKTVSSFKGDKHDRLGQVMWELKAVVDLYNLIGLCSAQLNRGADDKKSKKVQKVSAEDIGKSYEIVQILDGLFALQRTASDELKGLVRGSWVKGRDFKLDGRLMMFWMRETLRIELYTGPSMDKKEESKEVSFESRVKKQENTFASIGARLRKYKLKTVEAGNDA